MLPFFITFALQSRPRVGADAFGIHLMPKDYLLIINNLK